MTFTLLLDLDDTLLDTNMDTFIPAYFQSLAGSLRDHLDPNLMLPALMSGTKRMFENRDPARTLQEVFDAEFFPRLGVDRAALEPHFERYYDEVFPTLGHLTAPRPAAVTLVDWAFSRGWQVVIATNPLFPIKAIHHRLRWAGLPPEKYPFALVTSYEHMHFTKSPAYYAEVMARLGWPDSPVLMVGDEPDWDIRAARAAGIATFQVPRDGAQRANPPADGEGTIAQVRAWLEAQDLSQFTIKFHQPETMLAILAATPAAFGVMVRDIPPDQWARCPTCDEWSLNEIACHLRDVDLEVNLPRLRTLLSETNPFISGKVTDDWVLERGYDRQDGHAALRELTAARKQMVDILSGLTPEDWQRTARHAIFGPTTLQEMVGFTVVHDRSHIQQVLKTITQTRQA